MKNYTTCSPFTETTHQQNLQASSSQRRGLVSRLEFSILFYLAKHVFNIPTPTSLDLPDSKNFQITIGLSKSFSKVFSLCIL